MDSPGVERAPCVYKAPGQKEVHTGRSYANSRCWMGSGSLNNSSKNNPCFLGDIIGDWREEIVVRANENTLRINVSSYESPWAVTTLWADHEYRNAMAWQSVGYNQPPHPSFFLGELEGITKEPPAVVLEGRAEVANGGSIQTTDDHLLISGYENKTITVAEGAAPWVLTVNAPAWVKGSGSQQAVASTPKVPTQTVESFTTTLTGGAFGGATRLVKQGEGTLVLPNVVEKHTGNTDIWNGTLVFDGTMESSPVWLNRHTTLISDGGQFMGGLQADYNATVYPGGKDKVGHITVSTLTLDFGSRVVVDFRATTPEQASTAVDQLQLTKLVLNSKDWSYGPKYKAPVIELKGVGELAEGAYQIATV
jgi:autotransporter-associated beta strand protein